MLAFAEPAVARADTFKPDTTPLPQDVVSGDTSTGAAQATGSGGAAIRLVLGLAVVIALIFVVRWAVRRAKREPRAGKGGVDVTLVSTTPLGGTRAVHLLLVGDELVLVGSAEHGVTPLRVYAPDEARALLETTKGSRSDSLHPPVGQVTVGKLIEDLRRRTAR